MREIQFRAKRMDTGEWVQSGNLLHFNEGNEIFIPARDSHVVAEVDEKKNIIGLEAMTFYRVHGETVGQYTGLNDKDGKPVFDGDITRLVLDNGEVRHFTVKIETLERMIVTTYPGFEPATAAVQITGVIFDWHGHKLLPCVDGNGVSDVSKMEVVGNIYDNPELLEVVPCQT